MKSHFFPPEDTKGFGVKKGAKAGSIGFLAITCVILGVLIASNLDLSENIIADPSPLPQGSYPVVTNNGALESPFAAVIEKVTDAVVNISARSRNEQVPWWFRGGGYSTSAGSGFFFREDGYILTNAHVVADALDIIVKTASGYEYEAHLIGADPRTDLAVIKVEPEEDIPIVSFGDSEEIRVGDWAIAIGNPFPDYGLDRTVTVGVISAKGRSNLRFAGDTPDYQNYIQTDASINPGNSGGPLLNIRGEAIGVNAAISSPTGASVGIGFAIPINMARAIVPDLIETGVVSRGWLGVWLHPVTRREAKTMHLDAVRGVVIDSVFTGSPADNAGLESGDLITGFNGSEVNNSRQFQVLVSTVKSGMSVPIDVLRDGQTRKLNAVITDRESFLASVPSDTTIAGQQQYGWLGMSLVTFTEAIADNAGLRHIDGILVTDVDYGSAAFRASIVRSTIILQVNNVPVASVDDLRTVTNGMDRGTRRIPIIVQEPDGSVAQKVLRP